MPLQPDDLNRLLFQVEQARRGLLGEALAPLDLNFSQWGVLDALVQEGASTMTSLAKAIGADRTTLTRTVDGLVARGLVTRHTPPEDRRLVLVVLTQAGAAVAEAALDRVGPVHDAICAGLGAGEIAMTSGVLARMLTRARRFGADLGGGDTAPLSA